MNERERALQAVNDALPALRQIDSLYDEASSIREKARQMQAALDTKKAKKGWRRFFAFCGGYMLVALFSGIISPIATKLPDGTFSNIVGMVLMILFIIILAVGCKWTYKWLNSRIEKEQEGLDRQKAQMQQRVDAISREIYELTVKNGDRLDLLPRDYRYYDAAAYFERALANGQADSMKECISLYEEYLHRQRLEADSQRMLEENQRQSEMLESIRRSSAAAAVNSGVAATFSVMSFIASSRD